MEGMGGDNTNNQNNSNFLSIDHGSPVEQPAPSVETTPIDIYAQQNTSTIPTASPVAQAAPTVQTAPAAPATPASPNISSPNIVATQDSIAEEIATSSTSVPQVTSYEYENAFGIASDNADKDVASTANVGSTTDNTGFTGTAETPQFFSDALEQNTITGIVSGNTKRRSRTARATTPSSNDAVIINSGNSERSSGRGKIIAIAIIALIVVVGGVAGVSFLLTKRTERKADNQNIAELKKIADLIIYGEEKEGALPSMGDINKSTPYPGGLYNDHGVFDEQKVSEISVKYREIFSRVSKDSKKYDDYAMLDLYIRQLKALSILDKYNDEEYMISLQATAMNDNTLLEQIGQIFDAQKNDEMNDIHLSSTLDNFKEESIRKTKRIYIYRDAGCIVNGQINTDCRFTTDVSSADVGYITPYDLLSEGNSESRQTVVKNAISKIIELSEE